MASENFQRFTNSFLGDPGEAARDGLDIAALRQLEGLERQQAEELLLQRLATGDSRAAVGLGELGSHQAAPTLKRLLQLSETGQPIGPSYIINVAVALWQIEQFPGSMQRVAEILKQSPNATVRMEAAQALRKFSSPPATAALKAALSDEDGLVRYHAARSLLALAGKLTDEFDMPPLALKMMSNNPAERQPAAAELNTLI
jgi:HEAT repeat protein